VPDISRSLRSLSHFLKLCFEVGEGFVGGWFVSSFVAGGVEEAGFEDDVVA
jgi:hypothetical protein